MLKTPSTLVSPIMLLMLLDFVQIGNYSFSHFDDKAISKKKNEFEKLSIISDFLSINIDHLSLDIDCTSLMSDIF